METTSGCQLRCIMCARESALDKGTLKVGTMKEHLAMKIIDLLRLMEGKNASDVFVSVGKKPAMRIYGDVAEVDDTPTEQSDFDTFFEDFLPF